MNKVRELEKLCTFLTKSLRVKPWNEELFTEKKLEEIVHILSPEVTSSLPEGWQNLSSVIEAREWLGERINESAFLTISNEKLELIGFLLLYPETVDNQTIIHLGYLLGKQYWGRGYGTELIEGVVNRCREIPGITKIFGGVEKANPASGRVLEKCNFTISEELSEDTLMYELELF